ncbi:MAG TPA: PDR/VanB family oxidoreductase [Xanthobacteraceae bacterium]|nr:PDR/VanB family oxidoreductase [Xanthobacteraceae bacterium]
MLQLRVARIADVTRRIKSIELAAADGGALPAFTAGAHIDVTLGNGEERSYSLLNDPTETHRYVIAVLRETDSRGGSTYVHDQLRAGDILSSSEPINNFALNEAGERHILIAGGIGITPLLAMSRRLAAGGLDFTLHYCAKSRAEAAFIDEIEAALGPRLIAHFDGGDIARGLDVAALLKERPAAAHVYVCGPPGLIRAVREATPNWPKGSVHYELFRGSEADIAPRSSDRSFEIVLKRAGKTLTVAADKSILETLASAGIKVKTLCKEGVCGTCRVGLVRGRADHRDEVLTDEERERNIQVCVSRALPGETLVLDL